MADAKKARAIGFNHVALQVVHTDEALAFYGRLFDFELRSRSKTSAFIDLGDQLPSPLSRRAAPSPPMTAVISASSSMTNRLCAAPWRRLACKRGPVSFSDPPTLRATA